MVAYFLDHRPLPVTWACASRGGAGASVAGANHLAVSFEDPELEKARAAVQAATPARSIRPRLSTLPSATCCGIPGEETEDQQYGKEGLDSWVTKTQRRDTLTLNVSRLLQLLEALLPNATFLSLRLKISCTCSGRPKSNSRE